MLEEMQSGRGSRREYPYNDVPESIEEAIKAQKNKFIAMHTKRPTINYTQNK